MGTQKNHLKHMFKLMDKKIIAILRSEIWLNWPYVKVNNKGEGQPGNILCNPGVIHSIPSAFIMNAVGTEWITPGLLRIAWE